VSLIDCTNHILLYEQLDAFMRAVRELLVESRCLLTGSSGHSAYNVAPDAR
jgi:hypothetical protein